MRLCARVGRFCALYPQLQPIAEVTAQRLHPQPQDCCVPPTSAWVLASSQLKQRQQRRVLLSSVVPPTLPLLWQQGLQHDWPTKLGNVMPPKKPQELHISPSLHKIIPTHTGGYDIL